ncbi:hypothetical protein BGZ98_006463 [Dissophora globulifera]|nr:hypothetical protein BGZ98_006463 [Dissophora globulifera]
MATETVIYVSLALVLLTRIYVFINPPDFLEEHKDPRYHEYRLYRQYHLHKQDDPTVLLPSSSPRRSSDTPSMTRDAMPAGLDPLLCGLHPSDELVLLGTEAGAQPFPLRDLSAHMLSPLDPITLSLSPSAAVASSAPRPVTSPTATVSSSSVSARQSEYGIWHQILGSTEATVPVPNYISLDISEIHYSGSLEKFDRDPEVLQSIQELKAGSRDMAKECPTMTMIWEGGRWCCLEGRTLYIFRALEWKGQVRVRVLVDKDPMTLAVTEDYWKAAGMVSTTPTRTTNEPGSADAIGSPSRSFPTLTPISLLTSPSGMPEALADPDNNDNKSHVRMSAATAGRNAITVGVSLDDNFLTPPSRLRSTLLTSAEFSLPGSPAGHDADDEGGTDDEVESDGYIEDDESDGEVVGEIMDDEQRRRLETLVKAAIDMGRNRVPVRHHSLPTPHRPMPSRKWDTSAGTSQYDRSKTRSQESGKPSAGIWAAMPPPQPQPQPRRPPPAMVPEEDKKTNSVASPPSPPDLASWSKLNANAIPVKTRKASFGGSLTNMSGFRQHDESRQHERKISIPEFMLPPPLHDEYPYVIIEGPAAGVRENPPRRDSGHGDSP